MNNKKTIDFNNESSIDDIVKQVSGNNKIINSKFNIFNHVKLLIFFIIYFVISGVVINIKILLSFSYISIFIILSILSILLLIYNKRNKINLFIIGLKSKKEIKNKFKNNF